MSELQVLDPLPGPKSVFGLYMAECWSAYFQGLTPSPPYPAE